MKLLLISDIHGNFPALAAVAAAERDVDRIVCLGDLVNYGPHPAACVDWVRTNVPEGWIVQGNHDRALGRGEDPRCSAPYRELAAAMQRYTETRLDEGQKKYLANLLQRRPGSPQPPHRPSSVPGTAPLSPPRPGNSLRIGGAAVALCHAVPTDPLYGYLPPDSDPARWDAECAAADRPDFLFVGHTHLQFARQAGRTMVVNPGSVGQPKDGDPRAAYAVWEDGRLSLKRAAYDIALTARDLAGCAEPDIVRRLSDTLFHG